MCVCESRERNGVCVRAGEKWFVGVRAGGEMMCVCESRGRNGVCERAGGEMMCV